MLIAALTSLSCTEPQPLQIHSRSESCSSLLIAPQSEQVFDDGSNLPIFNKLTPYHSDLYFNISTNIPQPTSVISLDKSLFWSISRIFKSSKQIDWFSLIRLVDNLFKKSFRWFATFSCNFARFSFVLFPLYFENFRSIYFNRFKDFFKNFGLSIFSPLEVTKKSFIPKSIPIVVFSLILGFFLFSSPVSQSIEAKYLPVGVLVTVALFILPLIGLWSSIFIPSRNLGMKNLSFFNEIVCGIEKLCLALYLDLNFGKLFCPLKNKVKAVSKLFIECCKDCEFTSFNQVHSFLRSVNCLCKSKQDKLTLLPAQADCLVSRAKLYTNLTQPICLLISSACFLVGYKRYLNDFNNLF